MHIVIFFVLLLIAGLVYYGFGKILVIAVATFIFLFLGGAAISGIVQASRKPETPKPDESPSLPKDEVPPKDSARKFLDVLGIDISESATPGALPPNVAMVAGRFLKRGDMEVALLVEELAEKIDAGLGDYVTVASIPLRVIGICRILDRAVILRPENLILVTMPMFAKLGPGMEGVEPVPNEPLPSTADRPVSDAELQAELRQLRKMIGFDK